MLVGVDTPAIDSSVLTVAFADARRHGGRLVVLHARHGVGPVREHLTGSEEIARVAAWNRLDDELTPWAARFPDVPVEVRVVAGNAALALLAAAGEARLVVLGSRGHGAYARALFGSTSREVLRRSTAPVQVINPGTVVDEEDDTDPASTPDVVAVAVVPGSAEPRPPPRPQPVVLKRALRPSAAGGAEGPTGGPSAAAVADRALAALRPTN